MAAAIGRETVIDDYAHAARLQERYERAEHAEQITPTQHFRTIAAIAGLLKHFTGCADQLDEDLHEAAKDAVWEHHAENCVSPEDPDSEANDLRREWDYSDCPQAAVTYLQTLLAPSQPVNRGVRA